MNENHHNSIKLIRRLLGLFLLVGVLSPAFAAPVVGKKAAAKYFQNQQVSRDNYSSDQSDNEQTNYNQRYPTSVIESLSSEDHFMALGLSSYTSSKSYNWGLNRENDVAKTGIDMSYRLTQEYELFDEIIRLSYNTFKPAGQNASKLSFMYGITFPDASSKFPLYFGLTAGPGIFFKQIEGETTISFDYQMFLGLRLFNVLENTGFFVEGGIKNHMHLTSDGQLNGTYVSAGAVFTF